jgi:hypothetical protein
MQEERDVLLNCESYGDMLKHLNELGRDEIDPIALMRKSRTQECVIRARIEDFRAHHRLQLASGIAVSSAQQAGQDEEDHHKTRSSSTPIKREKSHSLGKKRHHIFKHLEKHHRFCR